MRCQKCNVDLGENYTHCPLCGATAVADAPTIAGQTIAEYPDIKYKPNPKGYFTIFWTFFAVVSAISLIIDKVVNGSVSDSLWVVFCLPLVWSFILRPIFIKKLYFGSYICHDIVYLSLLMLWIGKQYFADFSFVVATDLPIMHITGALVLLVGVFLSSKHRLNSVTYFIALLLASVVLLVVCAVNGYPQALCWLQLMICAAVLTVFLITRRKEVLTELAARFAA